MKFQTDEIQMFQFKFTAEIYAWFARRKGFKATVNKEGGDCFELGGRYGVTLENE